MKRNLLLLAITAFVLAACNSVGDQMTRTPIFKVTGPNGTVSTETPINIDGKPQEVKFRVFASDSWTVSLEGDSGFSLSDTSGSSGDTTVKLTASGNTSGSTRSVDVVFMMNGADSYIYSVTQEEEQPYLEPVQTRFSLSGYAQEIRIDVETNQEGWTYDLGGADWLHEISQDNSLLVLSVDENATGSPRNTRIRMVSQTHAEAFSFVEVEQGYIVPAPVADLLDVEFGENCAAKDISAMGMKVDGSRLDATVSTVYNEKYGRYVAVFSAAPLAAAHDTGFWTVPYTDRQDFAAGLEDGYSIELLFARGDSNAPGSQIKPFAATQAGGTGMCFRAATHEINWEVHTGGTRTEGYKFTGGGWRELYSGVVPQKDVFYHTVLTWDKAAGTAKCYVDGELKATVNAAGEFDHMVSNVNAYWFGIGADPNGSDKGELSFQGTIVLARIYNDPLTADQVGALYKLVE